ncbi:hypothetical protein H6P81_015917 [Aristolochia fimbriata]|uniref:Uncharacterized protein n=1 Tax=Aristolochia fimbriata TaxID=158543 RepID=A0AAV7E6W9_ARIFI|nr:hypothetical protein H6P81_015917 [Aristolochia fimbriata]
MSDSLVDVSRRVEWGARWPTPRARKFREGMSMRARATLLGHGDDGPSTIGLSPSLAPHSMGLAPGPSQRTLLSTTIQTDEAARFSYWAFLSSLAVTRGILRVFPPDLGSQSEQGLRSWRRLPAGVLLRAWASDTTSSHAGPGRAEPPVVVCSHPGPSGVADAEPVSAGRERKARGFDGRFAPERAPTAAGRRVQLVHLGRARFVESTMILLQVHLRKHCYDFSLL